MSCCCWLVRTPPPVGRATCLTMPGAAPAATEEETAEEGRACCCTREEPPAGWAWCADGGRPLGGWAELGRTPTLPAALPGVLGRMPATYGEPEGLPAGAAAPALARALGTGVQFTLRRTPALLLGVLTLGGMGGACPPARPAAAPVEGRPAAGRAAALAPAGLLALVGRGPGVAGLAGAAGCAAG